MKELERLGLLHRAELDARDTAHKAAIASAVEQWKKIAESLEEVATRNHMKWVDAEARIQELSSMPAWYFTPDQVEEMLKCLDCTGHATPCSAHAKQVWGSVRL